MADQQRAQQLVVGCLAASTAVAAGSLMAEGKKPDGRMLVGVAFTGVGLATLALISPGMAGGFAVLILTTTVVVYGEPFFNLLTKLEAPKQDTGGKPTGDPNVTGIAPAAKPHKEVVSA